MEGAAPNEVVGQDTATIFMKIQYWGGWGYRPKAMQLIENLKEFDGKIQY